MTRDFTLGKVLNDDFMLCYVPDYSLVGSAVVNVRVSYGSYMKT